MVRFCACIFLLFSCLIIAHPGQVNAVTCFDYATASKFTGEIPVTAAGSAMVGLGDWTWVCSSSGITSVYTADPLVPVVAGELPYTCEPTDALVAENQLIVACADYKVAIFDLIAPHSPTYIRMISLGSAALDLAYRNGLLLIGTETQGLLIYQINGPGAPQLLGEFSTDQQISGVCFTSDTTALVAAYQNILEIDLTNPAIPVEAASYMPPGYYSFEATYWDIDVVADRVVAIIADWMPIKNQDQSLSDNRYLDDPNCLLIFEGLTPDEEHLTGTWLVPNIPYSPPVYLGDISGFWLVLHIGNYAFGFDVEQPLPNRRALAPSITLNAESPITSVAFSEETICFATESSLIKTMINDAPTTVPDVLSFAPGQMVYFPGGQWAYSRTTGDYLMLDYMYYLWDFRQPTQPVVIDSTSCANYPHDYHYRKIQAATEDLLFQIDVEGSEIRGTLRDYSGPTPTAATIHPARDYAKFCGDLLISADSHTMDIFDVSVPSAPTLSNTLLFSENLSSMWTVGNYVLLRGSASSTTYLRSVYLLDPANPVASDPLVSASPVNSVFEFGDLAIIIGYDGLLRVLDPATMLIVDSFDSGGKINSMTIVGDVAWVGWGDNELASLDLSDPSNITMLCTGIEVPGEISSITCDGTTAYLACGLIGVHTVDITSATAPVYIGGGSCSASRIHLFDHYPVVPNHVLAAECSAVTPVFENNLQPAFANQITAMPNPFNGHTVLQLNANIPDGLQQVEIYNLKGQRIAGLAMLVKDGFGQAHWYGTDDIGRGVSSGVYLVRIPEAIDEVIGRLVYLK